LVLYDSLRKHCTSFRLYVLSLDAYTAAYFTKHAAGYPEIILITIDEVEDADPDLKAARQNRSTIEYYFTLSPCLPLHILRRFNAEHICSLDADILFLNGPDPLFRYLDRYSIVITPHKFSAEIKYLEKFGTYNVSFQIFKNDETGRKCLETWRAQCLEWCRDEYDEQTGRFADQKYLDTWRNDYPEKVKPLDDHVSGLAPWNLNNYSIFHAGNDFFSNGDKIIFYHFHHFKLFGNRMASNVFESYCARWQQAIEDLYLYYWNMLDARRKGLAVARRQSSRVNFAIMLKDQPSIFVKLSDARMITVKLNRIPSFVKSILSKLYA
jgi:hypothetical protein